MDDITDISLVCESNCENKAAGSSDIVEDEVYRGQKFRVNKFLTCIDGACSCTSKQNMCKGDLVSFVIRGLKTSKTPKYNLQQSFRI